MARLYLFAEGQTEQTFADTVLKPYLAGHGVYMHNPVLIAHARKKHRTHRGGGRNYEAMKNDISRFLRHENSGDVFFTTMIDLYALPTNFPEREEAEKLQHIPYERIELLEKAFANDIGSPRFISYIQLYEFEAYLFSNLEPLSLIYPEKKREIENLQKIVDTAGCPELINDGPTTAPSKRIAAQIPEYEPAKPVVGPQAADLIGLAKIREKCPHFDSWVTKLESLGTP